MDHTLREWIRLGEKCGLAQAALDAQAKETRMDRTHIRQVMLAHWHDMQSAIRTGLEPGLRSVSGLSGGQAVKLLNRMQEGKSLCGTLLGKAEAYALATAECNACMGQNCCRAHSWRLRHSSRPVASVGGGTEFSGGCPGGCAVCGRRRGRIHCQPGQHFRRGRRLPGRMWFRGCHGSPRRWCFWKVERHSRARTRRHLQS